MRQSLGVERDTVPLDRQRLTARLSKTREPRIYNDSAVDLDHEGDVRNDSACGDEFVATCPRHDREVVTTRRQIAPGASHEQRQHGRRDSPSVGRDTAARAPE